MVLPELGVLDYVMQFLFLIGETKFLLDFTHRLTMSEDLSPKMVALVAIAILGCTSKSFLTSSTTASNTFAREKPFLESK